MFARRLSYETFEQHRMIGSGQCIGDMIKVDFELSRPELSDQCIGGDTLYVAKLADVVEQGL